MQGDPPQKLLALQMTERGGRSLVKRKVELVASSVVNPAGIPATAGAALPARDSSWTAASLTRLMMTRRAGNRST